MSYDIIVVRTEVSDRCKKENLDIGQILEESPDSILALGIERKLKIKNVLLGIPEQFHLKEEDIYEVEKETDHLTIFAHKNEASIQVNLHDNYIFFKAGHSKASTILTSTVIITLEVDDLIRYDFQDGKWG